MKAIDVTFAQKLKELRTRDRMSQLELAECMSRLGFGWHQTTVAKVESGDRPVKLNEAVHALAIFGADFTELTRKAT